MTKNNILLFFGLVTIASITFGAYAFGKILSEREAPSVDERLDFLRSHQSRGTAFEQFAYIKEYGRERRPALRLNFASAGNCETFLDTAQYYLAKGGEVLARYPGQSTKEILDNASREDIELLRFYTNVAVKMADSYDDCLGNP